MGTELHQESSPLQAPTFGVQGSTRSQRFQRTSVFSYRSLSVLALSQLSRRPDRFRHTRVVPTFAGEP
jgi:hypothetical protein